MRVRHLAHPLRLVHDFDRVADLCAACATLIRSTRKEEIMRSVLKTLMISGLVGLWYLLGANSVFAPKFLGAQAAKTEGGPSEESRKKLIEAFAALKGAAETLEQENLYVSATN